MATREDPPELTDPDGHFPYRPERGRDALATPPDPDSHEHPAHWYISEDIIRASEAYVAAQAEHLRDPGDEAKRQAFIAATRELNAARAYHRRNRVGPDGQPAVTPLSGRTGELVDRVEHLTLEP